MLYSEFAQLLKYTLDKIETDLSKDDANIPFQWALRSDPDYDKKQGSVVIGTGLYTDNKEQYNLVLNNKFPGFGANIYYNSLIQMLQSMEDEDWKRVNNYLSIESSEPPDTFFSKRTIIVEDGSPDSVFSFYLLLLKLANVDDAQINESYLEAVELWERGYTQIPGEYTSFWPLLQSVLAHSHFSNSNQVNSDIKDNRSLTMAWIRSLKMLNHIIVKGYGVQDIPKHDLLPELQLARSACDYEQQLYENVLRRSEKLQLQIPIFNVSNRRKFVDTIFVSEEISSGIGKVFIRNESNSSYYGKGFGLQAMYRPHLRGSGNDLTISSDPKVGLDLTELWASLEKLENENYKELEKKRPIDKPREDKCLKELWDRFKIPYSNQPWYINNEHNLIAAPRATGFLKENKGTTLEWTDIKNLIWKLYHPAQDIFVTETYIKGLSSLPRKIEFENSELSKPLLNVSIRANSKNQVHMNQKKRIRILNFHKDSKCLSFLPSTTIKRIFASLIMCEGENISIQSLVTENSFEYYPLGGGFLVVSENGALIFNDWDEEPLRIIDASRELLYAKQRFESLEGKDATIGFKERIQNIRKEILGDTSTKNKEKLLSQLNQLKLEMEKLWRETEAEAPWKEMRKIVEKQWGLEGVLETLYDSVDRLESTLRSISDLRTGRLIFLLTYYGFPFVLMASFFSFVLQGWIPLIKEKQYLPEMFKGISFLGIGAYLTCSLSIIALLKLWKWWREKKS